MQRSYYQQLPLLPLGPEAIAELFTDLLGTAIASAPARAHPGAYGRQSVLHRGDRPVAGRNGRRRGNQGWVPPGKAGGKGRPARDRAERTGGTDRSVTGA